MKDFFVNIWIIVIIAVIVVGMGLGLGLGLGLRGGAPAEGQVTTELRSYSVSADGLGGVAGWATGDQWVYAAPAMPLNEMGTYEGTVTYTVAGEETVDTTACYKMEWAFDPPQWEMSTDGTATASIGNWTMWLEKDNPLLSKKMEMEGTVTAEGETHSFRMVMTFSNSVSGTMWPLAVGNELTVTTSATTWLYVDDMLQPGFPAWSPPVTSRTVIEAEEDVTVAAGTFHCFKMVSTVSGDGYNIQSVSWHSTEVKNAVKGVTLT